MYGGICWHDLLVILYHYSLSFSTYNNVIFKVLTCLFAFLGNILNQEIIMKRNKRGQKGKK